MAFGSLLACNMQLATLRLSAHGLSVEHTVVTLQQRHDSWEVFVIHGNVIRFWTLRALQASHGSAMALYQAIPSSAVCGSPALILPPALVSYLRRRGCAWLSLTARSPGRLRERPLLACVIRSFLLTWACVAQD
jgi:hypothetical protein